MTDSIRQDTTTERPASPDTPPHTGVPLVAMVLSGALRLGHGVPRHPRGSA
jgi:hypothetical protein